MDRATRFSRQPISQDMRQQRRRPRTKPRTASQQPPYAESAPEGFLDLVATDCLYFRMSQAVGDGRPRRPTSSATAAFAESQQAFREAFRSVWRRLPVTDRCQIRQYWDEPDELRLSSDLPRPLIEINCVGETASTFTCSHFGHWLHFRVGTSESPANDLHSVIARSLAQIYRLAIREHWALLIAEIEDPVTLWEQSQRKFTFSQRERQLDVFEAAYLQKYEAEIGQLLMRWGFKER